MEFWEGLVSGIQERRAGAYKENLDRELANRVQADRVFTHLLASRDPQIQQLAMSGLMQPVGQKKGGVAGFFGEVQDNPAMAQVLARMNEWIPDEGPPGGGGGGPTPPRPGSAAMSANAPVEPGSAAIDPLPAPPDLDWTQPQEDPAQVAAAAALESPPSAAAGGGVGVPPPAPPPSKWKRRGTQIPTAEEIAESTAAAQQRGRLDTARAQLEAAGATPQEIEDALMGMLGAPRNARNLSAVNTWGVILPGQTDPVPVLLDQTGGYKTADGQPLPPGAKMVRMSGSSGSVPRSAKEPDPSSPTGWSKVFYDTADGTELYRVPDTPYTPPPALSGTFQTIDAYNNQVVRGVTREGAPGPVLGPAATQTPSTDQAGAAALLQEVEELIRGAETPRLAGMPRRPLGASQRDQLVRERATAANLPYTTYQQLVQATKVAPARQVTPAAPAATGGTQPPATTDSMAERVRRRALENRGSVTPPPTPPARGRGVGPGPR